MAISDDFTIDLTDRRIYHSSGTTVYEMYELYAWLMDYFDESGTIDDPIPMSAQTPTSYTLVNGWYLNELVTTTLRYLKGGSLTTLGWDAGVYDYGIRVLRFQSSGYVNAVSGDLGREVGYAGGTPSDTGTLLDYDNTNRIWWVRVDDTGDTFANTGTALDLDNGTGTGAGTLSGASTTGEATFTNIYTLGTLPVTTQVYIYQAGEETLTWWSPGQIDILLKTREAGVQLGGGVVSVFARQYTRLYDHFMTPVASGTRTPIPLAVFADVNNPTGYRQMALSTASGAFVTGEVIEDDDDDSIQGIVTSSAGTAPNITLTYYLYNSTQTDFSAGSGSFNGQVSGSSATAVAPSSVGPAVLSGVTLTFGATSQDLNNENGMRPYDLIIDCNDHPLAQVYEHLKYVTRYGSSVSMNGHYGEDYTAVGDIRLLYDNQTGNFTEGLLVTGVTTGARGYIVADHDAGSTGALVLRDVVGTFANNESINDSSIGTADVNLVGELDEIAPNKQAPFGSFAGGRLFGARGVWFNNVAAADANNFQLIDSTGTLQLPPQTVALTVANTLAGDRVSVFRTTGNNEILDKSMFTIQQSHTLGVSYLRVSEVIPADTPNSGVIRGVSRTSSGSITRESRYEYSSWSNANQPTYSEFALSGVTTIAYDTDDTAYVPYIDREATGTTVSQSLVYVADRYVLVRVRLKGMLPFKIAGQLTNAGLFVTTIRTQDSIYV